MTITIELPHDVEERVEENARIRGLSPEEYAGQLIVQSLPAQSWRSKPPLTPEEFEEALDRMASIAPPGTPSIPDEALRRENMYEREDHML